MFQDEHISNKKLNILQNTGQRVLALRHKLGITQTELAKRIHFARNYISIIENGREPSHHFVRALEALEKEPVPFFEHYAPHPRTPHGRIKARRKELGLSLDELARLTGNRKSSIRDVEEGRAEAGEKLLRQLSEHLGLPLDELMAASDSPHFRDPGLAPGIEATPQWERGVTARIIPLLSWAQAGTTQSWENVVEYDGFMGFNVSDAKAVAVKIRGDSMVPQFPHGTIAIVYPTWKAKSGDLVLARLSDGTVLFRRLHVDGSQFTFIPLNPIYPPLTVEKSMLEVVLPVGGTFQSQL